MSKEDKLITIGIVEKEFFKHRIVLNNEVLGAYLYDAYINLLCVIGKETKNGNDMKFGLFTQVESTHKVRFFIVKEEIAEVLYDLFRIKMRDALNRFGKDCEKLGTKLLFQLNSGELTLKEFENSINPPQ